MRTKFLICGRTAAGKDTLTTYLCETFGLKQLISYTTRPRRINEGETHIFVSENESEAIQAQDKIIAYTKIGNFEYFGTYEQLLKADIYVIDPNGINYLKTNYACELQEDDIDLVIIYIHINMSWRIERAMLRKDDLKALQQRLSDEDSQFYEFEKRVSYDWFVNNQDGEKARKVIKTIAELYL